MSTVTVQSPSRMPPLLLSAGVCGLWIATVDQLLFLREYHPEISRSLALLWIELPSAAIMSAGFALALRLVLSLLFRPFGSVSPNSVAFTFLLVGASVYAALFDQDYHVARLTFLAVITLSTSFVAAFYYYVSGMADLSLRKSLLLLCAVVFVWALFTSLFVAPTRDGNGTPWQIAFIAHMIVLPIIVVMTLVFASRRQFRRLAILPSVLLLALGTQYIRARPSPDDATARLNVIMIVLDTMRRDHVGVYSPDAKTPMIDKFFTGAQIFENAYTPSNWTIPSMVSVFSSRHPELKTPQNQRRDYVPYDIPTLAESLSAQGYATGGFSANRLLGAPTGIMRGFQEQLLLDHHIRRDQFNRAPRMFAQIVSLFQRRFRSDHRFQDTTTMAIDRAREFLGDHHDKNFFMWLHLMSPHDPYDPVGFSSNYSGRLTKTYFAPHSEFPSEKEMRAGRYTPTDEDKEHVKALYRAEVEQLDAQLGEFLADLERWNLPSNTIIVLASDHGEEFWDHGDYYHGQSVYAELTRAVLLMRVPDHAPTRIPKVVSTIDLMPTFRDYLKLDPLENVDGRSLKPLIETGSWDTQLAFSAEHDLFLYGLRDERYSALWNPIKSEKLLFDRITDPSEKNNLAPSNEAIMNEYIERIEVIRRMLAERDRETGDDAKNQNQTTRDLEALGYL